MPDFTVARRGTDTSGRGIYATDYMWAWWLRVCDEIGFTPTIVQGAFMERAGGGAGASAGYHDGGGCFDLRTWDRTADEVERVIRTLRRFAAGAWVRDHRHGMDPHIHFVLGTDRPLDAGAALQWRQYLAGGDGLAVGGRDYHWRPNPLVTVPPKEDTMSPEQEKLLREVASDVKTALKRLDQDAAIRTRLVKIVELLEKREGKDG